MGRISQYPLDTDIQGNDKWIGTSVNTANATKNFSVDAVAEYLNKSAAIDSQALRYTYQNVQGDDVRLASTISFSPSLGDNVPFEDITEWIISAYSKQIKDVRTFYEAPLVGNTILITNAFNPSNWAIYRWDSVVEDIDDPNFYHIGLTYIQSTGGLEVNQDYLIALLDYGSGSGGDTWGSITGILSNQTDLQNALNAKQDTLISETNIKTINSTSLLGSGNISVQPTLVSGANIKTINGNSLLGSGNIIISTSAAWGSITGTLSSQTDLQSALNAKQASLVSGTNIQSINGSSILTSGNLNLQTPLVSGTNIKTINATTLLGSGDIAVQETLVSGTNIKTINGTSILGSGDISISSSAVWGAITGTLSSQTDLQSALNAKQDTLVSGTNIKTINGTSVLGSGDLSIAAAASGVSGAIQFSDGANLASDAVNLDWDNTNKRLGVGTDIPLYRLHIKGTGTTASTSSLYAQNNDGSAYFQVNDAGTATLVSSTSTVFITGLSGTRTYNINSLGGFGSSKVNLTGVMDLHSNDGTLALRVNDAFTGILKPTAIGQISAPASQAILELVSTTSGFLPPRMTTTQRDAIATPPDGLVLYNTTSKAFNYRINGAWEDFGSQTNARTTASAAINTTETILVSSPVLAANRMMPSTIIKITFSGTNTSSVAGASTFRVRVGTLGTTADVLMFTVNSANSAASGTSIAFSGEIIITVRTVGASSTAYGTLKLWNAGSTGISTVLTQVLNGTMTNFDNTVANIVSFSYLTAAATTTSTFQQATIEIID